MAEWHLSIANSIKTKTNYGVSYDGNGFYGKISNYGNPNHWEHDINGYVEWIKINLLSFYQLDTKQKLFTIMASNSLNIQMIL